MKLNKLKYYLYSLYHRIRCDGWYVRLLEKPVNIVTPDSLLHQTTFFKVYRDEKGMKFKFIEEEVTHYYE